MDASAETHASDGRRSSDCVVVVRKCFRACRRYSCRTETHVSTPQWWLLILLLTAICADQVCAVECSNLRLGPVFLDHLSPAPCLFQSLQQCRQLVVGRKRCTCVCGVLNPNSARIYQCGDEPDCGLRREADETTDSLDNQFFFPTATPEYDPVKNVQ